MPLMAHVRYMSALGDSGSPKSAERWLDAMCKFVEAERKDRAMIGLDKGEMSLREDVMEMIDCTGTGIEVEATYSNSIV